MKVYNYSEARQNFAAILNDSLTEEVIITRKDGTKFQIVPLVEKKMNSPFNVRGIDTGVDTAEILDTIRTGREYKK